MRSHELINSFNYATVFDVAVLYRTILIKQHNVSRPRTEIYYTEIITNCEAQNTRMFVHITPRVRPGKVGESK